MTPVFPSSSVETQPVVSAHRYHQTNGGHVDEERISSQDVNQLGNWDRLLEQMGFDGAPVNLSFEDECDDVLRGRKHDTVAISDEKEYIPTQFPSAGNSQEILYRLVCESVAPRQSSPPDVLISSLQRGREEDISIFLATVQGPTARRSRKM